MSVVTLNDAKAHLNILDNDDDAYIQTLIDVAEAQAEEITSRCFAETIKELYLDKYLGSFELPKSPLIAVDAIEYIPYDQTDYVLLNQAAYEVNEKIEPAVVRFLEVPSTASVFNAIKVTYRAGYNSLPTPIKQWVLIRVSTLFEHREEIVVGAAVSNIQSDYNDFLLSKYKVGRI